MTKKPFAGFFERALDTDIDDGPEPKPATLQARPITDFALPAPGDKSILIGNRWLSRGDIAILASTSGMGKSSLSIQAAMSWALEQTLFGGFKPNGPLKSLFFQSEDGDGDIAEVRLSLEHAMQLTPEQLATVRDNVLIVTDRIHRGLAFIAELKRQIAIHKPDIVWINPLLGFIKGDVNDAKDVGEFIREQLNSLNEPAAFAYIIIHHTTKPPKEKGKRQWNEVMYEMAGSADLTNAARAILALQATPKQGEFKFIGAKRGIRAGMTELVPGVINPEIKFEQATSSITIRHSTDRMTIPGHATDMPVIHWVRCEPSTEEDGDDKPKSGGRTAKYRFEDYKNVIPASDAKPMNLKELHRRCDEQLPINKNRLYEALKRWKDEGMIEIVTTPGQDSRYRRAF